MRCIRQASARRRLPVPAEQGRLGPARRLALRGLAVGGEPAAPPPGDPPRAPPALHGDLADWASLVVSKRSRRRSRAARSAVLSQTKRAVNAALERIDTAVKDADALQANASSSTPLEDAVVDCRSTARTASSAPVSGPARASAWRRPPSRWAEGRRRRAVADPSSCSRILARLRPRRSRPARERPPRGATGGDVAPGDGSGRVALRHHGQGARRGSLDHRQALRRAMGHANIDERAWAQEASRNCGSTAADAALPLAAGRRSPTARSSMPRPWRTCTRRRSLPIKSTRRQFERYVDWWGCERFQQGLATTDQASRVGRPDSVVATAERVIAALRRRSGADWGTVERYRRPRRPAGRCAARSAAVWCPPCRRRATRRRRRCRVRRPSALARAHSSTSRCSQQVTGMRYGSSTVTPARPIAAGRLWHAADGPGPSRSRGGPAAKGATVRALRDVAHRRRSHRRGIALSEGVPQRAQGSATCGSTAGGI